MGTNKVQTFGPSDRVSTTNFRDAGCVLNSSVYPGTWPINFYQNFFCEIIQEVTMDSIRQWKGCEHMYIT